MDLREAKEILLKEGYYLENNSDIFNMYDRLRLKFDDYFNKFENKLNDYTNGHMDRETLESSISDAKEYFNDFSINFKFLLGELYKLEAYKEQ